MKSKIIIPILLVLGHLISFGQTGQLKELKQPFDSIIENSEKDEALIIPGRDTWRLDSTISFNFANKLDSMPQNQSHYYYEDGKVERITQVYNNSIWNNSSKGIWYTNSLGQDSVSISQDWENDKWLNKHKTELIYNENGNLFKERHYGWNEDTKIWYYSVMLEYTYNGNNQETSITNYLGALTAFEWKPFEKDTLIYNTSGQLLKRIIYQWDAQNNHWKNYKKLEYSYIGQERSMFDYYWENDIWNLFSKTESILENNLPVENNSYRYIDSTWKHTYQAYLEFDQNGQLAAQESYRWNDLLLTWVGEVKFEKILNNQGFYIKSLNYEWIHSETKWVFRSKSEYSYNENQIHFYSLYSAWIEEESKWHPVSNHLLYYKNTTDVRDISTEKNAVMIYPNPTQSNLYINSKSTNHSILYKIFDLSGKLVQSDNLHLTNNPINISNLKPGNYIIKVTSDEGIQTGHFIKTR